MAKVKVQVCMGTSCFVKDSSNLNKLNDIIPEKYGDKVEVEGTPCLRLCSIKLEASKVPYVKVNEEIVEEANVEKILKAIDAELAK